MKNSDDLTDPIRDGEKEAIERFNEKLNYMKELDKSKSSLEGLKTTPSRKRRVTPKAAYRYPLIEVIWDDASTDNGWEPVPTELTPELVTTVGFLVRETDKHLLIANSYDPNHTNGRIQIPVGMIVSRKVIL